MRGPLVSAEGLCLRAPAIVGKLAIACLSLGPPDPVPPIGGGTWGQVRRGDLRPPVPDLSGTALTCGILDRGDRFGTGLGTGLLSGSWGQVWGQVFDLGNRLFGGLSGLDRGT